MGSAIKRGLKMFYIIVVFAAIFALPARADETLKYHLAIHVTSPSQNQRVGDVERHFLAVFRAEGTINLPDGSTGTAVTVATADIVIGSGGTENGYNSITFPDGSELWSKYAATTQWGETKNISKGTSIIIGGKGRYAGAKGDGTFEGEVTRGPDGVGQFDSVVNIKK
jgi:hypothetical protein